MMQLREHKRSFFSVVAIALFFISMVSAGSSFTPYTRSEAPLQESITHQATWPDSSFTDAQTESGTNVWWKESSNSTSEEWTWEHRNWLFGPEPTFEIYHENGSLIDKDGYAEIGEDLKIVTTVPKSIFTEGAELGSVEFRGWFLSPDWNYSASFTLRFTPSGDEWSPIWEGYSHEYNSTDDSGWDSEPFIDLKTEQCTNTSDSQMYTSTFVVEFNNDAPLGLYQVELSVMDTEWNWIGSYGYASGWEFQGLAVGMSPADAWSWSQGGSYTLHKLDMEGDPLYSVSRGNDFKMRFNVSGEDPEYVMLKFRIPGWIDTLVNVTGWHQEQVTETGGWEYNKTLNTYVWNPSIEVTYLEDVYGPYQQRQSIETGSFTEISAYRLVEEWNDTTSTWDRYVVNETFWVEKQYQFVYNTSTTSFETYFGYTYWGYPYETYQPELQEWNEEIMVLEPVPEDMPVFYELNTSLCEAVTTELGLTVDFVGHFTDKMPKTGQYSNFMFEDRVMGPEGWQYYPDVWGDGARQTYTEYEIAKQIAIETPVTLAKILNEDGTSPSGWMFAVEKGENFMVRGRLQGGGDIAADIDGVKFALEAYDSTWSEDEWRWSRLVYQITYDEFGIPTFEAFNRTEKQNYTYGTYMDWVEVEIEGWHYVYNSTTNTWEWHYGNYTEWQWTEVEGYHWQWWYYNQKTGKWQTNWIKEKSDATKVAADFCTTSDYQKWTDGGDLYISFLVNMSQTVPDTNYWWNYAFLNNSWYIDYSSEYGLHEIYSWDRDWVYSFEYNSERVYMDPWQHDQLAYYNDTLCTNEGSDFLLAEEKPYIEIDNEKLPVKVVENFDPWSGSTWENMFFYDHWDPETGKDYYYYELANGTKIDVTYTDVLYLYNVTLGTGESFLTGREWDEGWDVGGTYYYTWIDTNGVVHQGVDWEDYAANSPYVTVQLYEKIELDFREEKWYIRYGVDDIKLLKEHWRWDSRTSKYYMTDIDGNHYSLDYNSTDGWYYTTIGGTYQRISWPRQYFEVEYEGSDIMVTTWNVYRAWYHEDDGIKHEMPYKGANAEWVWDLENTESSGGKVPTTKSVVYGGNSYPVYNISMDYFTDIGGTSYHLFEAIATYSSANGTPIWNPDVIGFTANVGTLDNTLTFDLVESIQYNTTDSYGYPDDYNDGTGNQYITLFNETVWNVTNSELVVVHEYDMSGSALYSLMEWPYYFEEGNKSLYYYEALNGTWYNFTEYTKLPMVASYKAEAYYNDTHWVIDFMGTEYIDPGMGMRIYTWRVMNATYPTDLYLEPYSNAMRIYNFTYQSQEVMATAHRENIYRQRQRWGHELKYGPNPIMSTVYKNIYDLVIGVPEWGMWGVKSWTVDDETGALDLDGDTDTTDDQYYVLELYESKENFTHQWERLDVNINWDPNVTQYGDEMNIHSWMGLDTFTWSYEWNQTFYWYHADDMTQLGTAEMDDVKATILTEEGDPRPGYWDVSWMAQNVTWQDIIAEAEANGWDWVTSNEQSWTWLSFGINQHYGTSYVDGEVDHWLQVGLHYEYSGLMIWEDENKNDVMDVDLTNPGSGELSHYLIPDSVGSVSFVKPGEAYGNFNLSDTMHLGLEDEVTWGVTFTEVNGTVFPFTLHGYWGWYSGSKQTSDLRTFDERPTKITIDELSFLVHFQGYINETAGAMNNYAEIKVDNYVGDWDVHRIGGRDNLENRSLALNYFADIRMSDFAFKANGSFADSETTVSSERFELETAGAKFAEMIMGGVTYDWSKNTTAPYDVLSYTTPVGTFRQAYESDSGKSATAWTFTNSMYYVTIGFPEWEGYSVLQDPVFVSYTSNTGTDMGPGQVQFGAFSISPVVPSASDAVTVSVDIFTADEIYGAELVYTTDQENWETTSMWNSGGSTWTGEIPAFPDGTQIWYKVVVHTESGSYESTVNSYIVGQGVVTTGPTSPTGGIFEGLPTEILVLVGGSIAVIAIVALLVMRRRR